jgi:hypothetical protein
MPSAFGFLFSNALNESLLYIGKSNSTDQMTAARWFAKAQSSPGLLRAVSLCTEGLYQPNKSKLTQIRLAPRVAANIIGATNLISK